MERVNARLVDEGPLLDDAVVRREADRPQLEDPALGTRFNPIYNTRLLAKLLENSELEVYADGGHAFLFQPDTNYASRVETFLNTGVDQCRSGVKAFAAAVVLLATILALGAAQATPPNKFSVSVLAHGDLPGGGSYRTKLSSVEIDRLSARRAATAAGTRTTTRCCSSSRAG